MTLTLTIDGQDHTLEVIHGERVSYSLDGSLFEADVVELSPGVYSLLIGGKSFQARVAQKNCNNNGDDEERTVSLDGAEYAVSVRDPRKLARGVRLKQTLEGKQNVTSLMPGKVVRLLVSEGDAVERGQGLVVVEAMKMQNEIKCPKSGEVQKILVRAGQPVNAGEVLLTVE